MFGMVGCCFPTHHLKILAKNRGSPKGSEKPFGEGFIVCVFGFVVR